MKSGNFNWFLHSMMFYHTQHVIQKAEEKARKAQQKINANDRDDDDEDNEPEEPTRHWDVQGNDDD
jgi:hypothetical protein